MLNLIIHCNTERYWPRLYITKFEAILWTLGYDTAYHSRRFSSIYYHCESRSCELNYIVYVCRLYTRTSLPLNHYFDSFYLISSSKSKSKDHNFRDISMVLVSLLPHAEFGQNCLKVDSNGQFKQIKFQAAKRIVDEMKGRKDDIQKAQTDPTHKIRPCVLNIFLNTYETDEKIVRQTQASFFISFIVIYSLSLFTNNSKTIVRHNHVIEFGKILKRTRTDFHQCQSSKILAWFGVHTMLL